MKKKLPNPTSTTSNLKGSHLDSAYENPYQPSISKCMATYNGRTDAIIKIDEQWGKYGSIDFTNILTER